MTQQKIYIGKSSGEVRDVFIKHIKDSIFGENSEINKLDLDNLHNNFKIGQGILKRGTDQSTIFHKAIYSSFDEPNFLNSQFWKYYTEFCLEVLNILKIQTGYNGNWCIQRFPTIRFHFPGNISVFEFHRDSNYSHPIGEINCFYALNECLDSSALQVEKNLGFEDYLPLNLGPGQYALLNTSIYKHGDILNKTPKTRVSMDFRFIPKNLLNENKSSLTKGIKFTSDSYFIDEKKILNF